MSMLKRILITLGLLIAANLVIAQGILTGTITDSKTGEPLPFVNVIVVQNGQQMGGTTTDMNGEFQIKNLNPGTYDMKASFVGYKSVLKTGIKVAASGFSREGSVKMEPTSETLDVVEIVERSVPIIDIGASESGARLTAEDIENISATSVDGIIATVGGITDNGNGTAGSARGETNMQSYVNGVKKSGANLPTKAIGEIQVILGGTPASIGEAIGGATNITLRPPQNKFEGAVSYRTTEPFNTQGYHRGDLYLTGPVIVKKNKETGAENTILGFRLSAWGQHVSDPYYRPKDRRYFMAYDDVKQRIEQAPLRYDPTTQSIQYEASYLQAKDFRRVGRKSNLWSNFAFIEGGLEFRPNKTSILKVSGEFSYSLGKSGSVASMLLNNDNNGESESYEYQVQADFTQKLSSDKGSSKIKDVMLQLVGSYQKSYGESYNKDFKDDYFRYGHIGTFNTYKRPTYALTKMDIDGDGYNEYVYQQNGWLDYRVDFTPSDDNPGLAAYTSQLYNDEMFADYRSSLINYTNIRSMYGLVNGDTPGSIYGMYSNVGVPVTGYSKSETQQIYATATLSATIGRHILELGFQYDQAIYRSYSLAAGGLWTLMKQEANQHILYQDLDNPIIDYSGAYPVVSYDRKYDEGSQTYFDKSIRQKLYGNITGTEYIDIDSYDPSTFSIDMLSVDELYNAGNSYVSFSGYDYTGKKITGKTSLQDYFNGTNGKRELGAWQPIYMAGYIQDRFNFRDLIFNIGVRVDRYDGNQQGLKDPYLLYASYTVADMKNNGRTDIPAGVPDDAIVYVNTLNSGLSNNFQGVNITGYRSGEGSASTWYTASGEIVSDPSRVSGASGQPLPFRKGLLQDTGLPETISTEAFKDYEPQIVVMPRIAFSFPVSDKSEFKASYDVIARRPGSGYWQANYVSYLFMERQSGAALTNPNLKPEKITNYELSFQQALSESAALSISAYYKQTRDLINLVQYVGADPTTMYYSYDNQDFRTTKGLTVGYDLRRSRNVRISASYTLQYAEGTTGLPTTTILSLIRAGYPNVKMMFPISDDRRHAFKLGLDFRFDGGDKYNGPTTKRIVTDKNGEAKVKTIKWIQNFGVNITGLAQSGAPYTKYFSNTQSTIVGSYRGARLPWIFRFDMTINKAFMFKVGKRNTMLNAFCTIYNVLDTKGVMGVYGVTGDPDDNGYLTDPETQTAIRSQLDEKAYRNYYMMYLDNSSYNYLSPRRVEIGVQYEF